MSENPPPGVLVHVCRHGRVQNPEDVLYTRLPGYHLSESGRAMAARLGEIFTDVPLTHLRVSPMERARETMAPIAAAHQDLPVVVDWRLIEADSRMQGQRKGAASLRLAGPTNWHLFAHPTRSEWGEGFSAIAARVLAAIADAAYWAGPGGQAVLVSHQAPIWAARRLAQRKSLFNLPAMRQCALASITTFSVTPSGEILFVGYRDVLRDM